MKTRLQRIIDETEGKTSPWGAKSRFAKRIGASPTSVNDWLTGKSSPKEEYRHKISDEYGVNREYLDSGSGTIFAETKSICEETVTKNQNISYQLAYRDGQISELRAQLEWYQTRTHNVLKRVEEILGTHQTPAQNDANKRGSGGRGETPVNTHPRPQ